MADLVAELPMTYLRAVAMACLLASCGHARPMWRGGTERMATVTDDDVALLERMITPLPTIDAIAARMRIGELEGEPSTDQIERLVDSSIRWLDELDRTGLLDRARQGRCRGTASGKGDVISTLAAEDETRSTGREPRALDAAWIRPEHEVAPECELGMNALRAVATTRAWLEMEVQDLDVLAPFRAAVERIAPPSAACDGASDPVVDATLRFFFELRAVPAVGALSLRDGVCSDVTILQGPVRSMDEWPVTIAVHASTDSEDSERATAEVAVLGCGGGSGWRIELSSTPHGWRVVSVGEIVCILTSGCRD